MNDETIHQQVGRAVSEGWGRSGAFAGSIISGTLLGLLADNWLGTEPWLVVIGSLRRHLLRVHEYVALVQGNGNGRS